MGDQENILALMDKLSFFSIFSDAEKEYLSKLKNYILSCKANHVILRQGDMDTSLFILITGKVRVFKNERPKLVLAHLKPGGVFGEVAFLKKMARSANAVADTHSIYLKVDGELFDEMSAEIQNKFRARFLDLLIERLDDLNRRYITDAAPTVYTADERRNMDRRKIE